MPAQPTTTTFDPNLDVPVDLDVDLHLDLRLQPELDVFLRRWGDTGWRGNVDQVRPTIDADVIRLVRGVAGIEDDAFYMQVKLRRAGVLRWRTIEAFNAVWLTEETDHGRAFDALARQLDPGGVGGPAVGHGTFARDPRAALALPAMRAASVYRRGMLGGYLVRGMLVEYVAISVYGSLVRKLRAVDEPVGAEIVRRILVQEGRHLRFFLRSARTVLGTSSFAAALVRRTTESTWRPPGVDLYGRERWAEIFRPVLEDEEAIAELRSADAKVAALPGFEGTRIVGRYLDGLTGS